MKTTIALLTFFFCQASQESFAQDIPRTVTGTWADYDPHAEPLEVEVVREESGGGIITRYIRYVVGTFAGKKTKVAACLLYTSPSPRDRTRSRMPSSA